jgi:DNA-directed RNA polymerase specialized sigma24 family protein
LASFILAIRKGVVGLIKLIREYRATLRMVERARRETDDKQDKANLSAASSDLRYGIEYMATGRRPGSRRGITNLSVEQRETPYNPQDYQFIKLTALQKKPVSALSIHQRELLDDLLNILTPREKEAFELVRGQGYSQAKAAEILKLKSRGTVQNLVERAERKLRFVVQKPPISERNISSEPVLKKPIQRTIFAEVM